MTGDLGKTTQVTLENISTAFTGTGLSDLIKTVRSCKTAAEERAIIARESAELRSCFRDDTGEHQYKNMVKLIFIHILGYPTHWGQMACLRLLAQNGYGEKRIAYLALTLLLDERQEVLMLVTNSVKNDLQQKNQYIAGLALSALGSIGSAEMCRDCQPEVVRLTQADQPYVAKKAALAACRILRKIPDHAEDFIESSAKLLKSRHHGSLLAGVQLSVRLCELVPELALSKLKEKSFLPLAVKILKGMISSKESVDHRCGGVSDPFLQVWLLRLIRILRSHASEPTSGGGELRMAAWFQMNEELCDVLSSISSMDSSSGSAVPAVMYEAVNTILFSGVGSAEGLRVMAINVLGKFLGMKDNNLRYVALHVLAQVVVTDPQAVQRHRRIILDCVKDADNSIRRKALELVCALVTHSNVTVLMKELVEYLRVAEREFLEDLTGKVCNVAIKYSPEDAWLVDSMFEILEAAGLHVPEYVTRLLCGTISRATSAVQEFAVTRAMAALSSRDNAFVGVAPQLGSTIIWILGEFGMKNADAITILQDTLQSQLAPSWAKEVATISLSKNVTRANGDRTEAINALMNQSHSLALELQTRSTELANLLKLNNAHDILDSMPAPALVDAVNGVDSGDGTNGKSEVDMASVKKFDAPILSVEEVVGDVNLTESIAPSQNAPVDLMDLLGMDADPTPAPTAPTAPAATAPVPTPVDPMAMFDLLGANTPSPAPTMMMTPAPTPVMQQAPELIGINSAQGLRVALSKSDGPQLGHCTITATTTNVSAFPLSDYVLQVAVPKFIQLRIDPASGNAVPANSSGMVTQVLHIVNTMHGQKPVAVKLRATFKASDLMNMPQDFMEQGQVSFPL